MVDEPASLSAAAELKVAGPYMCTCGAAMEH